MCGLVGFYNNSKESINLKTLQKMARTMTYRGPDEEGYYLNRNCGLGHVRLRILDLSSKGRQPMKSGSSNRYLLLNGEIYNYLELKKILSNLGYEFSSKTDTEVLLYALEEWGLEKTLSKINGMFAFVYWMEEEKRLFLVRDRLGKKPLYYYHKGPHFVFGSELKSILQYPFIKKEIDPEALNHYFAFNCVPGSYAILKNTKKLPPAHYLEFSQGKVSLKKYWSVQTIQDPNFQDHETKVVDKLSQLLNDSIQSRLASDVPLGVFLSGGIDSTIITALLTGHSKKPVKTFSIGFPEMDFNEAPIAREVASFFKTDHHEYTLKASEILPDIEKIIGGFDEPFGDSSLLPTYYLSKKAKEEITVALGGDGGDELFGGYRKYRQIVQAKKVGSLLPYSLRKIIFSNLSKIPHGTLRNRSQGLLYENNRELLQYLSMTWKGYELKKLMKENGFPFSVTFFENITEKMSRDDLVRTMMHVDLTTYLPDDILTKIDRTSMLNSLEVRSPLLDYRLVEFASSLPLKFKILGSKQKYLLKSLLKRHIPFEKLLNRKKMGFCLPMALWFRGELKYLLEKYLSKNSIQRTGFFDFCIVEKMVKEHLYGRFDHSNKLFGLLAYQIWFNRYIENEI